MRRVAVIGCPGSGKSTLAAKLGQGTGLPVVFLDAAYHDASRWSADPQEKRRQWRAHVAELVTEPEWVIDGHYRSTLELRVAAADTVVFLDYPRWRCIFGALCRAAVWRSGPKRAPGGNPGTVDTAFLRSVWTFRRDERPRVLDLLARSAGDRNIHIITSPAQAEKLWRETVLRRCPSPTLMRE